MSHEPKNPDEFLRIEPGMPGGPSPKSFCRRCPERAELAAAVEAHAAAATNAEERHGETLARVRELEAKDSAATAYFHRTQEQLDAFDVRAGNAEVRAEAAESRLAAATALLEEWLETADEQELNASPYEGTEDFLAGQPAAPWRCQKCTGDHAASETCQPAAPPVAITQPAWSLPLRDDQPAAPSRFQGHPPFNQTAAPTRPPGDHGDRHNPDIAGYDPNCEHCVYTAPTRTEAYDAALSAEGMPDPELKQRYMLGRTEACDACPDVATCCVSGCTLKLRTKAERAVLDAMGELPEMWLEAWSVCRLSNVETLARAELARRGLR